MAGIRNLLLSMARAVDQFATWLGSSTSSNASGTSILQFNNDGTISGPVGAPTKWLNTTPDTTAAALYEIQWTASGGILTKTTSLTVNTWYPLSTGRSFSIGGTQRAADRVGSFTIAIRLAGSGGAGTSAVWTHTIAGTG